MKITFSVKAKLKPRLQRFLNRALLHCHSPDAEQGSHMIGVSAYPDYWMAPEADELAHLMASQISTQPEITPEEIAGSIRVAFLFMKSGAMTDVDAFLKETERIVCESWKQSRQTYEFVAPMFLLGTDRSKFTCSSKSYQIIAYEIADVPVWIQDELDKYYFESPGTDKDWKKNRGMWGIQTESRSKKDAFGQSAFLIDLMRGAFSLTLISLPQQAPHAGPFGMQKPWVPQRVPFWNNVDWEEIDFSFFKDGITTYHLGLSQWEEIVTLIDKAGDTLHQTALQTRFSSSVLAWTRACDARYPDERFFAMWNAMEVLCNPPEGDTTHLANRFAVLLGADQAAQDELQCFATLRNRYVHGLTWRGDESSLSMRFASLVRRAILRFAELMPDFESDREFDWYLDYGKESTKVLRRKKFVIDRLLGQSE